MEEIDKEKLLKEIEEKNKEIFFIGAELATTYLLNSLRLIGVINITDEQVDEVWEKHVKRWLEKELENFNLTEEKVGN